MPEHIVEKKTYYSVFGGLMGLLAATVGIAYIHLGKLNVIAVVTIAVVKAILIILYFMHVRYSSRLLWIFVGAGFFWLGILFALSFRCRGCRPRMHPAGVHPLIRRVANVGPDLRKPAEGVLHFRCDVIKQSFEKKPGEDRSDNQS